MIRLNQQRLIRQRLPLRFLTVTLLVALLWFIVMFLYVDDLISDQTQGVTRRHATQRQMRVVVMREQRVPSSSDVHDDAAGGETLVVYDHDTGRRLEVERVEDEYVEIWEHGKWVKGTNRMVHNNKDNNNNPISVPSPTDPTQSTTVRHIKIKSPYSRIRKKPEKDVNENNDFILLDEDTPRDGRLLLKEPPSVLPIIPANTSYVVKSTPDLIDRLGAKGSDDFHFAQKEILPTQPTAATTMPKLYNLSLSVKTPIKSSSSRVTDRPVQFQSTSVSVVPSSVTKPVKMAVKTSHRYANPKSARLRNSLVEPRQLPLPKHSGSSRRSAPSGRRSKHSRGPYREPPHININAKAGARINYVNINKKPVNLPNVNTIISNKTVNRFQWGQKEQSAQTLIPSIISNNSVHVSSQNKIPNPPLRLRESPSSARPSASPIVHHYAGTSRQEAPQDHFRSIDAQLDVKDGYGRHSFNVSASDVIPYVRDLPDTRPKSCSLAPIPSSPPLPLATVVICFHNEAWSTLLRTVHSVLARSPVHLLKEVILVDDYSSYDYLGARLETYISRFPQVQLVRTTRREGLIRARLLGVSYARGDVLVFLDSHCECNTRWLEPLLYAITQDRTKIACPQIDIISPDTFHYEGAPPGLHGGFNWHLQFVWKEVPPHQRAGRAGPTEPIRIIQFVWKEVPPHQGVGSVGPTEPIRTPTMIGGLFAVNRRYFLDIGGYDPGMEIWGGENLELSFRVWMCGGSIDILPCSRVGHLFRPVIPYGFPGGARTTLHQNAMRVAEVWMDQYKKFYYAAQDLRRDPGVLGSLSDRHRLRRSMHCQDFTWYLQNIVPEMDIPPLNAQHYGQLRNRKLELCVHSVEGATNSSLQMASCQHQLHRQQFAVTSGGEFVHYFQCVYLSGLTPVMGPCRTVTLSWTVTKEGQVVASESDGGTSLCLDIRGLFVVMATCDVSKTSQLWSFTYRFDINKLNIKY